MFRVSLRELLALTAVVSLAIVSLKYASSSWLAVLGGIVMLVFFAAIVVGVVDRGVRQAFAICFLSITATYGLIVLNTPQSYVPSGQRDSRELELWGGRLPTTRLMRYAYMALVEDRWVKTGTNEVLPNFDPANPSIPIASMGGGGMAMMGPSASQMQFPSQEDFVPIGHLWWALLFGYVGGRFGLYLYNRRNAARPAPRQ